jgi:uncharacterized HAD superfamily protein
MVIEGKYSERARLMKIAIDIDGTLCWCNLPVFLHECNTTFNLKIDPAILDKIDSKQEFYTLPEVQTARAHNKYIDDELAWIQFRKTCLLSLLLMDDAAEGVTRLSELGQLKYYTARYNSQPEIQQEIEYSTKRWLRRHRFINSTKVVFCHEIRGKVLKMVKLAKRDTVMLVDDSYRSVIEEINRLPPSDYSLLRERLTLVAIHAEASDLPVTDLHVIALPYWDEIETVIGRIPQHAQTTIATQTARHRTAAKA